MNENNEKKLTMNLSYFGTFDAQLSCATLQLLKLVPKCPTYTLQIYQIFPFEISSRC